MKNDVQQRQAAKKFVEYWTFQRGSEKGEDQQYWNSLLGEVLGIDDVKSHVQYQVALSVGADAKMTLCVVDAEKSAPSSLIDPAFLV